ncbi:hypothetical protein FCL54_06255 [Pseudalkalibacillus caeni]|uniref:TsaA-like domain-containing protein n=2 Tax=Exobacillus caeni TaxID=2574798 RepID=A0A5R9F6L4_9BACL|nr:hypothetical protein FCL54_06255 [Pseudalkalibacillus caeni]
MDKVEPGKIELTGRHPRNRKDRPKVGIFSQRAKSRPNQIGVSRCRILSVQKLVIIVQGLDAINGIPVLDIKPYMREFGPVGNVIQTDWATELMKDYYR